MTSNTTPEGLAFDSLNTASAYGVFGGSSDNLAAGNTTTYVGYQFTKTVKIFKYAYQGRGNDAYRINNTWAVELFVNGVWSRVTDVFTDSTGTLATGLLNGIETNSARVVCYTANTYASFLSPPYQTFYTTIQFYGRADV